MKRNLPPLNAVVAFESAARRKSFKSAGEELSVTSSAISHQIRSLEAWLGFSLFERTTRSVRLTSAGKRYMSKISDLLNSLDRATRFEAERNRGDTVIKVQTTNSFATGWLIPHLENFYEAHPDVSIQINAFDSSEGFRKTEMDIAILYTRDHRQESGARQLISEIIFPVCAPELFSANDNIITNLSETTLLHDDNLGISWQEWFGYAAAEFDDISVINTDNGHRYSHSHLALKAAALGTGITLASSALTIKPLQEKKLIAPFSSKLKTGFGYHLFQSDDATTKKRCNPLVNWLISTTLVQSNIKY